MQVKGALYSCKSCFEVSINYFSLSEREAVMLAKLLLWVCLLSLNQAIHWREGTALVMLAKLLLWVCLLSLNQAIHWREGTALVMFAKLLLWVCLLSVNQDIHWREGTTLVMLAKLLLHVWVCLLSVNQDIHCTLKGRYNIGNVCKTASMSMLTLFESRYTLKGRYSIGNVCKTASTCMSMLTLCESRYTLNHNTQTTNICKSQLNVEPKSSRKHWAKRLPSGNILKLGIFLCGTYEMKTLVRITGINTNFISNKLWDNNVVKKLN